MACKTSYDLHHNFPRLAEETGFAFNTHRPRVHIDWNKIRLIDIESLARDRKFVLIEQHVNDILDCVLESEFDVRILDEGVVKLFRLAQLAVEYQQFCRHYLDRSVFVLRQEIDTLAQDLAATKKDLLEKEDELRKLKRKGKHNYRPLVSYGNDNIATMILKTLTNKSDIFQPTANGEVPQYNKCNFCDKVFLNQLYLKSHISRRHMNMVDEFPQRDEKDRQSYINNADHENSKLTEEINDLKLKIKEMEVLITNNNKVVMESANITKNNSVDAKKEMKDAEVTTNNEDVFEKLEEWKKSEQESHSKEINLLKNQIFETLKSFRVTENKQSDESKNILVEQLNMTIKEQGAEIIALKQALTHSKLKGEAENKERKQEIEEQMMFWTKRDETQSKQYELLLEKLNEVAKEARESRALAEAERQRAGKLEALLKEKPNDRNREAHNSTDADEISSSQEEHNNMARRDFEKNTKPVVDHNTLRNLHRKAQELLNMKSSSSSDISSVENIQHQPPLKTVNKKSPIHNNTTQRRTKNHPLQPENGIIVSKKTNKVPNVSKSLNKYDNNKLANHKAKKAKKESSNPSPSVENTQERGHVLPPGSPVKVVRAKITEEVNNRLVQAGVDPLKSRLNQNLFQKQKSQLQQQQEVKSKKYPAYEQVRYTIMAYLDSDTVVAKRATGARHDKTMTNTLTKAFSLNSMISNIKSKALSLVKTKEIRKTTSLKSPPTSPIGVNIQRASPKLEIDKEIDSNGERESFSNVTHSNKTMKNRLSKNIESSLSLVDSDSSESDKHFNIVIPQRPSRSIDNLIKSPARRPLSANADHSNTNIKYKVNNDDIDNLTRTQSITNVSQFTGRSGLDDGVLTERKIASSEDIQALKVTKPENSKILNLQQTKSVLKNASSTSSLNKKKVLFDMDAIQMKSVSASPSQSLTEKSDDKYELGLVNIGDDEWDISSIENEPIKHDTKINVSPGQGMKIAELKQTIEAQLARRSETPSTAVFGGVDMLRGPMTRTSTIGGSNTSLGSSILDELDSTKTNNQKTLVKPKKITEKDDSELDISDFSIDGVTNNSNKNEKDSF
ncbi:hypothetical protein MSG28_000373 [Choristoneura fumiferana]|uniref:Uncharacterized protein n=2 Tax=Choristoneura fumiferana TaxID=7141 RepID=A0ACC0K111_CHOFU|nr:hypothetical protein MSG28_000373 [Choristoneura fumiferana]